MQSPVTPLTFLILVGVLFLVLMGLLSARLTILKMSIKVNSPAKEWQQFKDGVTGIIITLVFFSMASALIMLYLA